MLTLAEVFVGSDVCRQSQGLALIAGSAGQSRLVSAVQTFEMLDRGRSRLASSLARRIPSAVRTTRQSQQFGSYYRLLQAGIVPSVSEKNRMRQHRDYLRACAMPPSVIETVIDFSHGFWPVWSDKEAYQKRK